MRIQSPAPAALFGLAAVLLAYPALPAAAWQAAPAVARLPARAAEPAPLSRQERARLAVQDAEITAAARQVMALVDAGRIDEVWEGASPAMKRIVPRGEFVQELRLDRRRLGAVVSRGTPVVGRERYAAGGRVPQGEYRNVAMPTRFAGAAQPVRELVSFRLDEDRVWRVSGYSVR